MRKRLLFVCLGNACRSIMAEALMRFYWGNAYDAASAGLYPLGRVARETLMVLEEIGIPTDGLTSTGLDTVDLARIDCIVNLSEYPVKELIPMEFQGRLISWYIRDPYQQDLEAFRRTRDAIEWLVTEKIPDWV